MNLLKQVGLYFTTIVVFGLVCFSGVSLAQQLPDFVVSTEVQETQVDAGGFFDLVLKLQGEGSYTKRTPIDVVLVVDASGSMRHESSATNDNSRLHELQLAVTEFAQNLNPDTEHVALVTFQKENAMVVSPLSPFHQSTLIDRVNAIVADGGTPLGLGLRVAAQEISKARLESVKAIVVLSDGHHNTGPNPNLYYQSIPTDVALYTIGLGDDITRKIDCREGVTCRSGEDWLKQIAARGNGNGRYVFTPDADSLRALYENLLFEIRNDVVAENISAQLKLRPEFRVVSTAPTAASQSSNASGTRISWPVPELRNQQTVELRTTLQVLTRLATQPQLINYISPDSIIFYSSEDGGGTKTIPVGHIAVRGPANSPPVIHSMVVIPHSGLVNKTVYSFGVFADDPDGDPLRYIWSFDVGDAVVIEGCGLLHTTCSVKYKTTGIKQASVIVQDPSGASDSSSQLAQVNQTNLAASCSASTNEVKLGEAVLWRGIATGGQEPYQYRWQGDDGLVGNAPVVSYAYSKTGDKRVLFTVTDGLGNQVITECTTKASYQLPVFIEVRP
ncbi:MAG TPA: hypothetical protein DIS62_04625 [Candidatus Kerfeldbacteria bacterium]|nr:hypothetical protein [Candidatus Kerfeldbacteria bacterium]